MITYLPLHFLVNLSQTNESLSHQLSSTEQKLQEHLESFNSLKAQNQSNVTHISNLEHKISEQQVSVPRIPVPFQFHNILQDNL